MIHNAIDYLKYSNTIFRLNNVSFDFRPYVIAAKKNTDEATIIVNII